jgi:hypothetical protein
MSNIYYKLYATVSYAEACQTLVKHGVTPMPSSGHYFYAEDLTEEQITNLSNVFTVKKHDAHLEAKQAKENDLKWEFSNEVNSSDLFHDKFSEVCKQYQAGKITKDEVHPIMREFALKHFPQHKEAIEWHYAQRDS